jgi:peptidyl-prolyl cis-trans isomerase SurA
MSRIFMTHIHSLIAVTLLAAATAHAQTGGVVATDAITELEIEQRSRLTELSTRKAPEREDVINQLRNEKRRVREARELGVDVTDSEVDEAYGKIAARMRLTTEQLTEKFAQSSIDLDTIKIRIRADLIWLSYLQRSRQDLSRRWHTPDR